MLLRVKFLVGLTLAFLVMALIVSLEANAQHGIDLKGGSSPGLITSVPRTMTYQGILKDGDGNPILNESKDIIFRIYDDATVGELEWGETIQITTDDGGYFTATLNNLEIPFDEDYWLELEVDSEILSPRQKLNMVAYAAVSDTADYARTAAGGGWVDDGPSVRLETSSDKVGIGTSSPGNKLHVVGAESVPILNVVQNGSFRAARFYSQNACALWVENAGNHGLRITNAGGRGVYVQNAGTDGIRVDNAGGWAGYFNGTGYFSDNVGIGTTSPSGKLHVATDGNYSGYFTSENLSGSTHIVHAEYTGVAGDASPKAVYGKAVPSDGNGVGGYFEGGYRGVQGTVMPTGSEEHYTGVFGYVDGGSGDNYGVYGSATNGNSNRGVTGEAVSPGVLNIGVYGTASGATQNWAGYFYGRGFFNDNVGIGTTNPAEKLDVVGNIHASGTIGSGNSITIDGVNDKITASSGTIDFDDENLVTTGKATIGPGHTNAGVYAFIAGLNNATGGNYSTVGGGWDNAASADGSTVGGGVSDTASGTFSTVGGGALNVASGQHSTVAGGNVNLASGLSSTVSGGAYDTASGVSSCIGGGIYNIASGNSATVGGGFHNRARGLYSVVSGGGGPIPADSNSAIGDWSAIGGGNSNTADADNATVGGGAENSATNSYSTVPGGYKNTAAGHYSFAAGNRAKANHHGAFVWADQTNADFASTGVDQFLIRASGGVGIGTTSPDYKLDVLGSVGIDIGSNFNDTPLTIDVPSNQGGLISRIAKGGSIINVVDKDGHVGIGTFSPQGALDVNSTTGAFIVPRMTTAQRDALSAVNGMIVYNTTTNQFNFYENGAWVTK